MLKSLPRFWLFALGTSLFLFTMQPWSLRVANMIPIQVLAIWALFFHLMIFRNRQAIEAISIFTNYQWFLIFFILTMIAARCSIDSEGWIRLMQPATGVLLALCGGAAIYNARDRKHLFLFLSFAAALSAFVAMLQYFGLASWSWRNTSYFGFAEKQPSGLETSPVAFSYGVIAICTFILASTLHDLSNRNKKLSYFSTWHGFAFSGLIMFALLAAMTRSGMLGVIVGVAAAAVIGWRVRRPLITPNHYMLAAFLFLTPLITTILLTTNVTSNFEAKINQASGDARISGNWASFLPTLPQHPLGIENKIIAAKRIDRSRLAETNELKAAFRENAGYMPHNFLLTSGLSYGPAVAVALFLLIFSALYRGYATVIEAFKMRCGQNDAMALALVFSANLSLLVHGWFHNASPVLGEMRWWFWLGTLTGLTKWLRHILKEKCV